MRTADENRSYFPIAFRLNPDTRKITEMRIIAESRQLPKLPEPKARDLGDVIFSGGIRDGVLYAGVRDAAAYAIRVVSRLFGRRTA
jgi:hypothetical protein